MPTEPRCLTSDVHPTANRLLGAVPCALTGDRDAATELFVLGLREIDAVPVLVGSGRGRFEAAPWGLPIPGLRGVGRLGAGISHARGHHRPHAAAWGLRRNRADRGPATGIDPVARVAFSRQRSWPRATPQRHRSVTNRPMRLRAQVECGSGGVQGRDSRRHASLPPSAAQETALTSDVPQLPRRLTGADELLGYAVQLHVATL